MVVHVAQHVRQLLLGMKRDSKKIANNTYQEKIPGGVRIRLHNTPVVVFYENGKIVLNSGGWQTVTTKDRINRNLGHFGFYVNSIDGRWYVNKIGEDRHWPFFDGMVLYRDKVTNSKVSSELEIMKKRRQERREEKKQRQRTTERLERQRKEGAGLRIQEHERAIESIREEAAAFLKDAKEGKIALEKRDILPEPAEMPAEMPVKEEVKGRFGGDPLKEAIKPPTKPTS